ncbi:MAG: hypothetical protein ACJA2S_004341 [Cyclobacteriaceae bacterium]|jgi:hypothetical protein
MPPLDLKSKKMKNTTNFFTKIIIGLFYEECNTWQGQKENEHNYMMDDGHTEIMKGDDHIGDDEQHDNLCKMTINR